jgi:hypothetical protein
MKRSIPGERLTSHSPSGVRSLNNILETDWGG